MSKDPIGLVGGLNNSAYVSDPNHWIDPMGLKCYSCRTCENSFIDDTLNNYTETMDFKLTDIPIISNAIDKVKSNKYASTTIDVATELNPLDAPWIIAMGLGGAYSKALTDTTGVRTYTLGSLAKEQLKKSNSPIKSNKYGPYTGKQVLVGKAAGGTATGLLVRGMYSSGVLIGSAGKTTYERTIGNKCEN